METAFAERRNYEAERGEYQLGLRNSTDVLDAEDRLAEARISEAVALVDYQIAQVDLAFATGTLLGAAKVSW
jgi:outer membrane protein TolC